MIDHIKSILKDKLADIEKLEEGDDYHEFEFRVDSRKINNEDMKTLLIVLHKMLKPDVLGFEFVNIIDDIHFSNMKKKVIKREMYACNDVKDQNKIDIFPFNNFKLDFDRKSLTDKKSTEYIEKSKVLKYKEECFGFSYAIEKNLDKKDLSDKVIESLFKKRAIFKLPGFTVEYTIFYKNNIREFVIESELKDKRNMNDFIRFLKSFYLKVANKGVLVKYIDPMNPHSFERKNIPTLLGHKYAVGPKADGERYFFVCSKDEYYLINPKTKNVLRMGENTKHDKLYIFDGEYLPEKNIFYVFDTLFLEGKDMRGKSYDKRYEASKDILKFKDAKLKLDIKVQEFKDIFNSASDIWKNQKKLDYDIDGLIFTPINQFYTGDLNFQKVPIFKWKDKLSIDVRVEYNYNKDFTYFHNSSYSQRNKIWGRDDANIYFNRWTSKNKTILENNKRFNFGIIERGILFLGMKGKVSARNKYDIVEMEYDDGKWKLLRNRTQDKKDSNKYKTIEGVLKGIIQNITIDTIKNLPNEEVKIGELYDSTRDVNKKRDNWRKFHNHIKKTLIEKYNSPGASLLDLGCGKGGDLHKWQKAKIKNVLALDTSYVELYGDKGFKERLLKLNFKDNGKYFTNGEMNICIANADISKNILDSKAGLSKEENDKIKYFLSKVMKNKKFDNIQSMYVIHYLFGSSKDNKNWKEAKRKIKSFVKNVRELLSRDGKFYGVYLNGDDIKKDMKFVKDGEMFYEIINNPLKKNYIPSITIKNIVWGNVAISEPKLTFSKIKEAFNDFKVEKSLDIKKTLDSFNLELSEDEKKLGMINDTFCISKK